MSAAVCDWCGLYVESSNHRHPGFCAPSCRDLDRQHRQAERDSRRQARADARDKVDAYQGRWGG